MTNLLVPYSSRRSPINIVKFKFWLSRKLNLLLRRFFWKNLNLFTSFIEIFIVISLRIAKAKLSQTMLVDLLAVSTFFNSFVPSCKMTASSEVSSTYPFMCFVITLVVAPGTDPTEATDFILWLKRQHFTYLKMELPVIKILFRGYLGIWVSLEDVYLRWYNFLSIFLLLFAFFFGISIPSIGIWGFRSTILC